MLTEVVTYTRLPAACSGLELVPRILAFNIRVDGLEVHLARGRRRNGLVDQNDIVGSGALELFLGVILDAHLGRRSSRWSDRLCLFLKGGQATVALLRCLQNTVIFTIASV
jgi:hypothetical protein